MNRLKIGQNAFEDPSPLLQLFDYTGAQFTHLDVARFKIQNLQQAEQLALALNKLSNIQELSVCGFLELSDSNSQEESAAVSDLVI